MAPYIILAVFAVFFFCIIALQTRKIADLSNPIYVVFLHSHDDGTSSVTQVVSFPGPRESGLQKVHEHLARGGFYSSDSLDPRRYMCSNNRIVAEIYVSDQVFSGTCREVDLKDSFLEVESLRLKKVLSRF